MILLFSFLLTSILIPFYASSFPSSLLRFFSNPSQFSFANIYQYYYHYYRLYFFLPSSHLPNTSLSLPHSLFPFLPSSLPPCFVFFLSTLLFFPLLLILYYNFFNILSSLFHPSSLLSFSCFFLSFTFLHRITFPSPSFPSPFFVLFPSLHIFFLHTLPTFPNYSSLYSSFLSFFFSFLSFLLFISLPFFLPPNLTYDLHHFSSFYPSNSILSFTFSFLPLPPSFLSFFLFCSASPFLVFYSLPTIIFSPFYSLPDASYFLFFFYSFLFLLSLLPSIFFPFPPLRLTLSIRLVSFTFLPLLPFYSCPFIPLLPY